MSKKIQRLLILIILLIPFNVYSKTYVMCHDHGVLKALKILAYLISIIKVLVPVFLIISASIVLAKAIMAKDNDNISKSVKELIIKFSIGIAIFFLPTIIYVFFENISEYETGKNFFSYCARCLNDSNFCDQVMFEYPEEVDEPIVRKKNEQIKVDPNPITNFPQLKPASGANIIAQEDTDTLKFTIEKVNSGDKAYYISRIWVKDAYLQHNKINSSNYGKELKRPKAFINDAISKYNLQDKAIIAFNASGFVLNGIWGQGCYDKDPSYNKTSNGTLVITNGQVVRNIYKSVCWSFVISGIDKSQTYRFWHEVKRPSYLDTKEFNQKIISSGIKNTFTFGPVLVSEGKKVTMPAKKARTTAKRQALCQINKNNFMLFTGGYMNLYTLQEILLKHNCVTGVNLDGGGSASLLYKSKSSSTIKAVYGNARSLAETAYFSE